MAYFYRSGLGPGKSNHVLDPDFDKSVEIGRTGVQDAIELEADIVASY